MNRALLNVRSHPVVSRCAGKSSTGDGPVRWL